MVLLSCGSDPTTFVADHADYGASQSNPTCVQCPEGTRIAVKSWHSGWGQYFTASLGNMLCIPEDMKYSCTRYYLLSLLMTPRSTLNSESVTVSLSRFRSRSLASSLAEPSPKTQMYAQLSTFLPASWPKLRPLRALSVAR